MGNQAVLFVHHINVSIHTLFEFGEKLVERIEFDIRNHDANKSFILKNRAECGESDLLLLIHIGINRRPLWRWLLRDGGKPRPHARIVVINHRTQLIILCRSLINN
ncbi:Uncharacterised protein [Vibrio cholerae]|uniref:Uncharacterized protein n=1 Tax=Vibrio cholerae TaxID=666 RepID=A0A655QDG0_VIBCL|nr:Uncharacterised protein [Vibrio cholerae]CSA43802.1 Uncharacterised protein [Vibrio cholerae]CSA92361.1 Uncharacterised protein [Vibrio cholerae]CSB30965.1 Uncharacterised protein [Vibrio cholerae]CSB43023.1 Uncharacterised protein [Vibrio cholerae]